MRLIVTSIVDVHRSPNTRLHHFIEGLMSDHEVTVVCPHDTWRVNQTDVEAYGTRERLESRQVEVRHLSRETVPIMAQVVLSEYFVQQLDLDFDAYDLHLDYSTLFLGHAVSRRVRRAGGAVLYDLADDIVAMVRDSPQLPRPIAGIGSRVAKRVLEQNLRNATSVTCISETLAREYSLQNTHIISNGVSVEHFRPGLPTDDVEKPNTRYTIGYVGTNREWVNLTLLVDVVAELREEGIDVGLLVVGEEGGISHVKQRCSDLDIGSACVFTGTVPYSAVPYYVNAMDIGMIPFIPGEISMGSLPLKLFEYLACGIPVVSSRIKGIEQAAGNLVRFAEGKDETVACSRELLANPQLRQSIGDDGRELVTREYSWDTQVDRLEACMQAIT